MGQNITTRNMIFKLIPSITTFIVSALHFRICKNKVSDREIKQSMYVLLKKRKETSIKRIRVFYNISLSLYMHNLLANPVMSNVKIRTYPTSCAASVLIHDDVIKWKHFPRYWPFVRGIYRSPVNSAHKGQWRGALMFSLICIWINGWVNNREAGD